MGRVLLLNSNWQPLNFVSDFRALVLLYKGKVEVVEINGTKSEWGETFKTASIEYNVPATIRLFEGVHKKIKPPKFRRRVLFARDGWKCQYCSAALHYGIATIDHVIPKCMGGETTWRNCVTACKPCNRKKGNKMLNMSEMTLLKKPADPNIVHFWNMSRTTVWHSDWDYLIPNVN